MNIYDMNQVSKKTIEKKKKIEKNAESFLEAYYKKQKEEQEAKEKKKSEEILSNARFSNSSIYSKNKQRQKAVREYLEYNSRANNAVMADAISRIVENSLLIDAEEYAKLNPDYKKTIKETVLSFLENADLNVRVTNKHTLALMENLTKRIPDAKTGVYLKEDEIVDIVKREPSEEVEASIETLSGDVKEKVANLVSDEQSEAAEIQNTVDELVAVSEAAREARKSGILNEEDEDAELDELESEEEVVADSEEGLEDSDLESEESEESELEELESEEEIPSDVEEEDYLETDNGHTFDGTPLNAPKTSIKVSPEGEISIDVFKEEFFRETPKKGILESLAFNEAMEMIKEGKPYNPDLAIANALTYVTILETFNATGLLTIDKEDYKKLVK
jgi:gas vesicle protein